LFASFVKQVYNYIFVATDEQNVLLKINGAGVIVGIILGLYMIPSGFGLGRGLLGATITQIAMELVFMGGAIYVGMRKDISPILNTKILGKTMISLLLFGII
jgi:O-antigen/teichoic acid export membrane protein